MEEQAEHRQAVDDAWRQWVLSPSRQRVSIDGVQLSCGTEDDVGTRDETVEKSERRYVCVCVCDCVCGSVILDDIGGGGIEIR